MTSISEMATMKTHSKEWNQAAFEGVDVPDYIKVVSAKICEIYGINGQCDPGYIANLINMYVTEKPTVCPVTTTGEHCHIQLGGSDDCMWCHNPRH